ncbi:hypothetical protein BASA83_013282 [Batrachochytrium salamandrivorans]|nr:hypothetical protein BASA83_013282 [Batrachochytrium salamandrivorans]
MSSRGYDDGRRDRSPRRDVSYGRRDDNRDRPPPFGRDSPRSGGGGYRDDRGPPVGRDDRRGGVVVVVVAVTTVAVTFGEMTVLDTVSIGAGTIGQKRRSVSPGAGGDRRPRRDDHRGDGGYPPSRGSDRGGGWRRPNSVVVVWRWGSSGNSNPYETNVFELDPAFSAKFETEGSGINQPNRNRWPTPPIVHATHGGGAYLNLILMDPFPRVRSSSRKNTTMTLSRASTDTTTQSQIVIRFKGELAPKYSRRSTNEKTMLTGESGGSQSCDAYTEHIRIQEELRLKRLQNL